MNSEPHDPVSVVTELVRPSLSHLGIDLVDVRWSGRGRGAVLTLTIDRPGGVTLDDCEVVSNTAGAVLDAYDPIAGSYRLEVTSPGAERPLRGEEDWRRALGRRVNVRYRDGESDTVVEGRLLSFSASEVEVEVRDRRSRRSARVPAASIVSARVLVDI
jgi:ribosome maturation factor RimP